MNEYQLHASADAAQRSNNDRRFLELADELEAIRSGVDAFNPDARMAVLSAFDAAERVWKMVPKIIATLRSQPRQSHIPESR